MSNYFQGDAIEVSKYFHRFARLREAGLMKLRGDNVLVEKLPPVEIKLASGLVMATDLGTHKNTLADAVTEFGLVLMVGPGQILDDGSTLEVACKPGDVVLLPQNTFWYSQFGHMAGYSALTIGRVRDH